MSEWTTSRIDRLGRKLKSDAVDSESIIELDQYRGSFEKSYAEVVSRLRALDYEVTGRPAKSTGAIVDKLNRQNIRLAQMQDIAGCRVIVPDTFLQDRAMPVFDVYLGTPNVFDRREDPSNGYRAVHLIANINGRKVEVQLRTELQHLWAEISEKLSDLVDPGVKYGKGGEDEEKFLRNLSYAIARVERDEVSRARAMEVMRSAPPAMKKRFKQPIKAAERSFFAQRDRLVNLLNDIHQELQEEVPE